MAAVGAYEPHHGEEEALLSTQRGPHTAQLHVRMGKGARPPAFWRVVVVGLLCACNVSLYLSRANISIAAVFMFHDCLPWQKWVLAGFYLGYTCSLLFAGRMAQAVGGKKLLCFGVSVWSAVTLACVPAFEQNRHAPLLLVLCRVVIGAAEGCNYPAQLELVGAWVPECERTSAWTCLTCGEAIGTILAMLTSPFLHAWAGWQAIFYVTGAVGAAWVLLFGMLVTETPETHWGISRAELDHIVRTRPRPVYACSSSSAGSTMRNAGTNKNYDNDGNDGNTLGATPFAAFVRLPAFWGTVTAHFCYNYMSFLALSLGPFFFSTKYNIDIDHFNATGPSTGMNLGYIACLPYVVLFASQFPAGILADYLHNKGALSLTQVRKLFNTLGMLCAAVFFGLLASPVVQQGPTDRAGVMTALLFLSGAVGFGGVAIVGHWANYHDLSPKYGSLPPRSCCATHAAEPALPADPFAKAAGQGRPSCVRLVRANWLIDFARRPGVTDAGCWVRLLVLQVWCGLAGNRDEYRDGSRHDLQRCIGRDLGPDPAGSLQHRRGLGLGFHHRICRVAPRGRRVLLPWQRRASRF